MPCDICQNNSQNYDPLKPCSHQAGEGTDSSKIIYTGPTLDCIDIESGATLQSIIQKIDAVACGEGADYGSFDYSCLEDDYTITNAQEFAEAISQAYCDFKAEYDEYVANNSTSLTTINNVINTINNPSFPTSCAPLGITSSDTLKQAVQKLINRLCVIDGLTNPSSANWNQCNIVSPLPTTLNQAFNIIIQWICDIQSEIEDIASTGTTGSLPTFNNLSSCLPSPTSSDTLYDTIVKIRTVLCAIPSFDENEIIWPSCIPEPSDSALDSIINAILDPLNSAYQKRIVAVDAPLTLSLFSTGSACAGYKIGINPGSGLSDKLVAINASDNSPNYLENKIIAGTNIAFNNNGSTITINAASSDHLVLAGGTSDPPGKLIDKIRENVTGDDAITLQPVLDGNGSNSRLYLEPTIDYDILALKVLTAIEDSTSLTTLFCAIACACQPCNSPAPGKSEVYLTITNNHSDIITVGTTFSQNNPTLAFYSGTNLLGAGSTTSTGAYITTSATSPISTTLAITNSSGSTLTYDIKVYDGNTNNVVANSSQLSGSINNSQTLTFPNFSLGDYKQTYTIKINYDV